MTVWYLFQAETAYLTGCIICCCLLYCATLITVMFWVHSKLWKEFQTAIQFRAIMPVHVEISASSKELAPLPPLSSLFCFMSLSRFGF